MTINKADELFDTAFEAIRQLLREAGRKGTPEHAEVLIFAREKMWTLQKIIDGQADSKITTAPVHTMIADQIQEQAKVPGITPEKVIAALDSSRVFQKAVSAASLNLARSAVRREISRKIQRATTTVRKAAEVTRVAEVQLELAFENIEEFRALPPLIRYLIPAADGKPARIERVDYRLSNQEQRRSSLELHAESIKKNKVAYDHEYRVFKLLEPLVAKYGDLPPAELWAKKLRDDRRAAKVN